MQTKKHLIYLIIIFLVIAVPTQSYNQIDQLKNIQETELQDELNNICQQIFQSDNVNINMNSIIKYHWSNLGMDFLLDNEIDKAIEKVRNEEGYINIFVTGWSTEKAKELFTKVSNTAFGSEKFNFAIENLSYSVAKDITKKIEIITEKSAKTSLYRLTEFIGNKYPLTIKKVFQKEIVTSTLDVSTTPVTPDISIVWDSHKGALTGIGVIIVSKITQKIARTIAKRIASKLATRVGGRAISVIPYVGWIIGGGLIVWDLIEGKDGALPEIEKSLKSQKVKDNIQNNIANTINQELYVQLPEIARKIANEVYSYWNDFKLKFNAVLSLSEENEHFKNILENSKVENFYKIAELVDIINRSNDRDYLLNSIENGLFAKAILLPDSTFGIIESSKSIQTLLDWSHISGLYLGDVVKYEIYKYKQPIEFDRHLLTKLLYINHEKTISKLLLLENEIIEELLTISTKNLIILTHKMSINDLRRIAWFKTNLNQDANNYLISHLILHPDDIERISTSESQNYLIKNNEKQKEVLSYLLMPNTSKWSIFEGIKMIKGDVPFEQYILKYSKFNTFFIAIIAVCALFILIIFLKIRKIFRRRDK